MSNIIMILALSLRQSCIVLGSIDHSIAKRDRRKTKQRFWIGNSDFGSAIQVLGG